MKKIILHVILTRIKAKYVINVTKLEHIYYEYEYYYKENKLAYKRRCIFETERCHNKFIRSH